MASTLNWSIEVRLTEDADRTEAHAILRIEDRQFRGFGRAKRNPEDPVRRSVGEELATARAISDLSDRLLHDAADALEGFVGHKVKLRASPPPLRAEIVVPGGDGPSRRQDWGGYLDEVAD